MRVCLSMIVKNEAAVIERCLRSVLPHIDSWAISDTGSTDGTQDIVRRVLAGKPGELIERPWIDFAHNRNEALDLARRHGELALIIDADEVLQVAADAPRPDPSAPGYLLEHVQGTAHYWRVCIVRLDLDWHWEGVLHEVLLSSRADHVVRLPGWRAATFADGARSQQPASVKYGRDAEILRQALEREPNHARYTFYYAQSLRDAGRIDESIRAYRRRSELGGWDEEIYYAKLQIALLLERSGAGHADIAAAYLDACDVRPSRAEAPCEFARYLRLNRRYRMATVFARIALELPASDDMLFVDGTVHAWRAKDELAVSSWYCGDSALSAQLCEELLVDGQLPDSELERVETNLRFAESLHAQQQGAAVG
ncbi:MAG TPA: glycosyltransferase [Tahibacter sp.]|uniref:glycosyltransferase n=1 Tax=Tahibacter sp. TaxID=2056211 RepID=UPI002CEA88C5|nr:glycosyltransferase [Tahibacter sp.]HSX62201.1 glycosyltransferase [Tahibacter sp.]